MTRYDEIEGMLGLDGSQIGDASRGDLTKGMA